VFDFWATWCGPCKIISPIFEKFAEEYTSVGFYKVDVDDQTEISEEVGVRAVRSSLFSLPVPSADARGRAQMPTFAVFKNGAKVKDFVGANPGGLQQLIKEFAS
jgi:thioredoxin 1